MGMEICCAGIRLVDQLKYVQNYTSRVGRAPLLVEVCRKCNEFRPVYMKSIVFALIPSGQFKQWLKCMWVLLDRQLPHLYPWTGLLCSWTNAGANLSVSTWDALIARHMPHGRLSKSKKPVTIPITILNQRQHFATLQTRLNQIYSCSHQTIRVRVRCQALNRSKYRSIGWQ